MKCETYGNIDKIFFYDKDGEEISVDYDKPWWYKENYAGEPKCLRKCPYEIAKVKGIYGDYTCFKEDVELDCRDKKKDKDKDKKWSFCFSKANIVEVQGKGLISMDSLQIGDFVRAGNNQYSRVYSFIHLNREVEADFLQIHAEGLNKPLEVTPEHMVFVENAAVPASQVKVGDMLGESKVSEIKTVNRNGVFAPVTESGSIVVSGALASSYAAVRPYSPIDQHTEAHALFSFRRMVCAFDFGICKSETSTEDGLPEWLSPLATFGLSTKQNAPAQLAASLVGLPIVAVAYIVEQIILSPLLIGAFALAFIAKKKVNASSKAKLK